MKHVVIANRRWGVRYGEPGRSLNGVCDFDRHEIIVRPTLTLPETLGVAIHEALHAAYPWLTEEAIEAGELGVVRVLRAMDLIPAED